MPARLRDDTGLTLVETLIAVAIMGLAFAALLGGLSTSILGSDLHRGHAEGETVIRRLAEDIKAAGFDPCPAAYPVSEAGFTVDVAVAYWTGSGFSPTCLADPDAPQKVTLSVTRVDAQVIRANTETLELIKRKP